MAMYKCKNFGSCSHADSGEEFSLATGTDARQSFGDFVRRQINNCDRTIEPARAPLRDVRLAISNARQVAWGK